MSNLILSLILGFSVGGSLGLLGGGGSILTVPALVYVLGLTPQVAVTTSLVIVGVNSLIGTFFHRTQGLNWRVALIFGGAGMVSSYFSAGLSKHIPANVLMILFALLMLVVGVILIRQKTVQSNIHQVDDLNLWKVLIGGAIVGILTGILGVGGGFLIVPALVLLVGMPVHHAVGTSLVVIAMNSFAGFLGHLDGVVLDIPLILTFIVAGVFGLFAGAQLGKRLDAARLRKTFSVFIISLALFLLYDNISKIL
jgi:uncharacterized protein